MKCQLNENELRNALSIAESNGEDDVINIEGGHYRTFGEPFNYLDMGLDRRDLTIRGEGKGLTILDGEGTSKVLNIIRDVQNPQNIFIVKNLTPPYSFFPT